MIERFRPEFRRDLIAAVALALGTGLVYAPTFWNEFVKFDDNLYVYENARVLGGLSRAGMIYAWTTLDTGNWMPLTWLSLESTTTLFGPGPQAFHGVNIAYHAVNTVLFFVLLHGLTGAFWKSFIAAALFGCHPLHVESVAWASERKDVLSTFWLLVTVLLYVRYTARLSVWRYVAVAGTFSVGLLCKSMLVTLPVLLLLLDVWPLWRWDRIRPAHDAGNVRSSRTARQLVVEKLPLLGISFAFGLATVFAQHQSSAISGANILPLPYRLGNALLAYGWYLWKTCLPMGLAAMYSHPIGGLNWGAVAISTLVLGGLGWLIWRGRARLWLPVGSLWYVISLLPVIGLLQVGPQAYADRYAYVTHLGLLVLLVWETAFWLGRLRLGAGLGAALASVCLTACAALTMVQIGYWRNTETLWVHALQIDPDDWFANFQLGTFKLLQGEVPAAEKLLTRCLQSAPRCDVAMNNLGWIRQSRGDLAQAERLYRQALELRPKDPNALFNLATVQTQRGNLSSAIANLSKLIVLQPDLPAARNQLGLLYARQGDMEKALQQFSFVIRQAPQDRSAHNNAGIALAALGRREEAVACFETALRLEPNDVNAHVNLANVLAQLGRRAEAQEHLSAALKISPDDTEAQRALDGLKAQAPAP